MDGLVHDCSNSIANTLQLMQSCTKASILLLSIWMPYHPQKCQNFDDIGHNKLGRNDRYTTVIQYHSLDISQKHIPNMHDELLLQVSQATNSW